MNFPITPFLAEQRNYPMTVGETVFITSKIDFPQSINGVITLEDNKTYFITASIDLEGDRLVCGQNTTIIGGSSENCVLKSTGLIGQALISSQRSLLLRHITIEADIALNLNANGNPNQVLDWFGVNLVNCPVIGTIANYGNFFMLNCALINSANMIFDGDVDTVDFIYCSFDRRPGQTILTIANTANILEKFQISHSTFVVLNGETGINVFGNAIVNNESYILDTVDFKGSGTFVTGTTHSSNKAFFTDCIGISNSGNIAQYYMVNSTTSTPIPVSGTFYKILGTTSSGPYIEKFTLSNNRATYQGASTGYFKVSATISASSGNVQLLSFRVAVDGSTIAASENSVTTSGAGRVESVKIQAITLLNPGQYIEIFATNNSATTNIIVSDLNVIIERLN
jgi:hypothetical protein